MPKVIIVATGKSGTNVIYHILQGSKELNPCTTIEDKSIFRKSPDMIFSNYLCKCDTIYIDNLIKMVSLMYNNKDAIILWPTRHPNDLILSKITTPFYSRKPWNTPDDATIEGSIESIEDSNIKLQYLLNSKYRDRVIVFKFEEILDDLNKWCNWICERLCIEFDKSMLYYMERFPDSVYRNKYLNRKNKNYKWKNYKEEEYYKWLIERGFGDQVLSNMFKSINNITLNWEY